MSNKKLGNDFESEFCKLLSDHGFWVHNMANRKNGQPADVIAVKNNLAYLLDCKVCSNDKFDLRRIEDNQHLAMQKWERCGNGEALFAFKMSNGEITLMDYETLNILSKTENTLSECEIYRHGESLQEFLEWVDNYDN